MFNATKKIITHVSYHNNQRTILNFPKNVCLNDSQLGSIGAVADVSSNYHTQDGCFGLIKEIVLYDGNVEIERVDKVNLLMGQKNSLNRNDLNTNKRNGLVGCGLGNEMVFNKYDAISSGTLSDTEADTDRFLIHLKDVFNFLKVGETTEGRMKTLPCDLVNFRLEIVWNSATECGFEAVNALTILEPVLLTRELVGAKSNKTDLTVVYNSWERESFGLDAVAVGATQQVVLRLSNFHKKHLQKLLVLNIENGKAESLAMSSTELQISVNGKQLLPTKLVNDAVASSISVDSLGDRNCLVNGSLLPLLPAGSAIIMDAGSVLEQGKFNYQCYEINQNIDGELIVDWSRVGIAIAKNAITKTFYGLVKKTIQFRSDRSVVAY